MQGKGYDILSLAVMVIGGVFLSRNKWAILTEIALLAVFSFSSVTACTTVRDVTVSTRVSLLSALYSLSSGATLLLPLFLALVFVAFISYAGKQTNVGFLFASAAFVVYAVFLLWYSSETRNTSHYAVLEGMLKEQGVRFKKRDVIIHVVPNPACYLALALNAALSLLTIPPLGMKEKRYLLKREMEPYAFIAPHVLFFVVFSLVPAVYGIYTAFTRWDLYNEPVFNGLANLRTILADTNNSYYAQFRTGLINTVKHVVFTTPFLIVLPMCIALAMHTRCRGRKLFQSLYYLPSLLSASTVVLAWQYVFKRTYGVMNNFFMSSVDWYTPPYTWVIQVVVTVWWGLGANMIIYQSALAGIPQDQYEAASIDGANGWLTFWRITVPNMRYPIMYTFVTTLVAEFGVNAQPEMLFGFRNSGSNAVIMMYIRMTAMQQGVAGIGSAMAFMLGICIMAVTFFQIRVMRSGD